MTKTFIILVLLIAMAHNVQAERRDVLMETYHKNQTEKKVNRAPMRINIDVFYDSDTHIIEVVGDESIEAEVFLKADGILEDYSSTLNTVFTVSTSGLYVIIIQGDDWYAEGEIEIQK